MTTIAILGAAAVQDDAVRVARSFGWTVHVLAAAANGPAAQSADVFAPIDFSNVEDVKSYVREHGVDAVYSTGSDFAIPVSAQVSEDLEMPRFVTPQTASTCNQKSLMRRTLADMPGNVKAQEVKTAVGTTWDGPWPVIVKPADAQGQRGVARVNSPDGLVAAIEAALPHSRTQTAIIEEFIEGTEVSVNGYMVDGRLVFVAVSDRETWPEYVGLIAAHVAPGTAADDATRERVSELMQDASRRLGIENGPVYAQVMIRDGMPHIIEITPRLDGCHMWKVLRESAGVDLMEWTLRHLVEGSAPEVAGGMLNPPLAPVQLRFHCQEPGTEYDSGRHPSPKTSIERCQYYTDGDTVRPINGRFEKVGYDICREDA